MFEALQLIKAKLDTIVDIKSCKIGLEDSIAPADYPIIRIVSGRSSARDYLNKNYQVKIYFGFNLSEFDGLELIYEKLYALDKEIRELLDPDLDPYICKWVDTISDEDRLQGFKILCAVYDVQS